MLERSEEDEDFLELLFVFETCRKFKDVLNLKEFEFQVLVNAIYDKNGSSLIINILYAFISNIIQDFAYTDEEGVFRSGLPYNLDLKYLNSVTWPNFLLEFFKAVFGKRVVSGFEVEEKLIKQEDLRLNNIELHNEIKNHLKIVVSNLLYSEFREKFITKKLKNEENELYPFVQTIKEVNNVEEVVSNRKNDEISTFMKHLITAVEFCVALPITDYKVPKNEEFFEDLYSIQKIFKEFDDLNSDPKTLFLKVSKEINEISKQFNISNDFQKTQNLALQAIQDIISKHQQIEENDIEMTSKRNNNNDEQDQNLISLELQNFINLISRVKNGNFWLFSIKEKIKILYYLANELLDCDNVRNILTKTSSEIIELKENLEEVEENKQQAIDRLEKGNESFKQAVNELFETIEDISGLDNDPILGLPFVVEDEEGYFVSGVVVKRLRYGENELISSIGEYFNQYCYKELELPNEMDVKLVNKELFSTVEAEKVFEFPISSTEITFKGQNRVIEKTGGKLASVISEESLNLTETSNPYTITVLETSPELENIRYRCILANQESFRLSMKHLLASLVLIPPCFTPETPVLPIDMQSYSIQGQKIILQQARLVYCKGYGYARVLEVSENDIVSVELVFGQGFIHFSSIVAVFFENETYFSVSEDIEKYKLNSQTLSTINIDFAKKKDMIQASIDHLEQNIGLSIDQYSLFSSEAEQLYAIERYLLFSAHHKYKLITQDTDISEIKGVSTQVLTLINKKLEEIRNQEDTVLQGSHIVYESYDASLIAPQLLLNKEQVPYWTLFDVSIFLSTLISRTIPSFLPFLPLEVSEKVMHLLQLKLPDFEGISQFERIISALLLFEEQFLIVLATDLTIFEPPIQHSKAQLKIQDFKLSALLPLGVREENLKEYSSNELNTKSYYVRRLYKNILESDTQVVMGNASAPVLNTINRESVNCFLVEWMSIRRTWRALLNLHKTNELSVSKALEAVHTFDQAFSLLHIELNDKSDFLDMNVGDIVVYDNQRHSDLSVIVPNLQNHQITKKLIEQSMLDSALLIPLMLDYSTTYDVLESSDSLGDIRFQEFEVIYARKFITKVGVYAMVSVARARFKDVSEPVISYTPKNKDHFIKPSNVMETALTSLCRKNFCYICLRQGELITCDVKGCGIVMHLSCMRLIKPASVDLFGALYCCPLHALQANLDNHSLQSTVISTAFLKAIDSVLEPGKEISGYATAFLLPVIDKPIQTLTCLPIDSTDFSCLASLKIACLKAMFTSIASVRESLDKFIESIDKVNKKRFPKLLEFSQSVANTLYSNFEFYLNSETNLRNCKHQQTLQSILVKKQRQEQQRKREVRLCLEAIVSVIVQDTFKRKRVSERRVATPVTRQATGVRRSTRKKRQVKKLEVSTEPSFTRKKKKRKLEDNTMTSKMVSRLKSNLIAPTKVKGTCSGCTNCIIRCQNMSKAFIRDGSTDCLTKKQGDRDIRKTFRYKGIYLDKEEFLEGLSSASTWKDVHYLWSAPPRFGVETTEKNVHSFLVPLNPVFPSFIASRRKWRHLRLFERK